MKKTKIMFVCSGNICRSPLAHRLFEKKAVERGMEDRFLVESSGTTAYHVGENADPRMRATAGKHGLRLSHRSMRFERNHLSEYDHIFVMGDDHLRAIRRISRNGADLEKVYLFRAFDPAVAPADGSGSRGPGVNRVPIPEVPDPWYGGMNGFEEVYAIVERTCDAILDRFAAGELA